MNLLRMSSCMHVHGRMNYLDLWNWIGMINETLVLIGTALDIMGLAAIITLGLIE